MDAGLEITRREVKSFDRFPQRQVDLPSFRDECLMCGNIDRRCGSQLWQPDVLAEEPFDLVQRREQIGTQEIPRKTGRKLIMYVKNATAKGYRDFLARERQRGLLQCGGC